MKPSRDDREKEALEWAIKGFRGCSNILTTEGGKRNQEKINLWADIAMYDNNSNLHYPGGREAWLQQLKDTQHDPARRAHLCNFAAALIERGDPLPQEMRGFIADYLRGRTPKIKRKPGPGPNLNARNDLMTFAAAHLVHVWGFPLTRNEASEHPPAASIITEALKSAGICLTESAVNGVFRTKRSQQYFRTFPTEL